MKALLLYPRFPQTFFPKVLEAIAKGEERGIWQFVPNFGNNFGLFSVPSLNFLICILGLCTAGDHFWEYRVLARERMTQQLGFDPLTQIVIPERKPALVGG